MGTSRSNSKSLPVLTGGGRAAPAMEALLRQVLEQVGVEHSPSTAQDDSGSAEEVVLDLHLEGARYRPSEKELDKALS